MMTGSERIEASILSNEVSMKSQRERASAGAIEVLKEEGPASLTSRQLTRVFDIGEVFVVSDDGDRMRGSLDVLFPFL